MSTESIQPPLTFLPSAEAMTADTLSSVTARDETRIVLLAGPVASGKTTIVVSLYESFNEGPVGGLLFAGSRTLAGFERVCHPGRIASGLGAPETLRTNPSSPTAFLHLRVADVSGDGAHTTSLLVSDVTGEAFDEARDVSEPTIIPRALWRRADVICVVLDGEKMSATTKRQTVRNGARSLLRAARESKLLPTKCRLVIVTTKWDQVTSPNTETFVAETESLLIDQFSSDFEAVTCHRIAARPRSTSVPYAFGVPGLLTEWVSRPPAKPVVAKPEAVQHSGLNEFARLFWNQHEPTLGGLDAI